ncbi:MAG: trypsin-like serine protease [Prevotellaceae bacterium]|jgi:hypothetical protein|nr:trypsin-like serine protease [Prevotellaceae bacterium]
MKLFLSIFFVLIFLSLYSQVKIINGKEVGIEAAPWTANMRIVNTAGVKLFDRSGVIVSKNFILTASHNWPDYEYKRLVVHVGGASDGIGQYHEVRRFIRHPNNDIMLLELAKPLQFGKKIQAIDYKSCTDESLYAPETNAVIYGWGRMLPNVPAQTLKLMAADVKIISHRDANMIYGASVVSGNVIVSVGENTMGMAGKGDSGGPLVVLDRQQNPVLAGITIYADTREMSKTSGLTVYSKIKPMIEWIDGFQYEIVGPDTVSSVGTSFEIVNMPSDAVSVEWTHSGLTKINSTMNSIDVLPYEIENEVKGYVEAKIATSVGTVTVYKELTIMPRIDIDINVRYNEVASKYEMYAKTVNMEAIDNTEILKCKNIVTDVKMLGFVWTYNNDVSVGQVVIFDINPNPPKMHTISVTKYNCDHTVRLEKSFFIHHTNNEFVTVFNEPGMISIGSAHMSLSIDDSEKLQMTYSKKTMKNRILLNTSHVHAENLSTKFVDTQNCQISIYSRTGNLLYSEYFDISRDFLHIDTSPFSSGIYILHIHNLDTDEVMSRALIVY